MSIWPHPIMHKKEAKNGTYTRKNNGSTGLKFGMQTQPDSANNMGWVPSGHTSSSVCKAKNVKNGSVKKNLGSNHMFTFFLKVYNMSSKQIFW